MSGMLELERESARMDEVRSLLEQGLALEEAELVASYRTEGSGPSATSVAASGALSVVLIASVAMLLPMAAFSLVVSVGAPSWLALGVAAVIGGLSIWSGFRLGARVVPRLAAWRPRWRIAAALGLVGSFELSSRALSTLFSVEALAHAWEEASASSVANLESALWLVALFTLFMLLGRDR